MLKPLIAAAKGIQTDRHPVWFLRQAGRYLPEYREIRQKMSFLELCQDPKMACEVTLQPLRRFDLDAAIIFSDILILPKALGVDLSFAKDHGPILNPPILTAKDLKHLNLNIDVGKELSFVGEAIELTKKNLAPHQTMIGFAGAPHTVACYMIEGQGSKNFSQLKKLLYTDKKVYTGLLTALAETTFDYLKMQVSAGAEVLMLFDTWLGNMTTLDYLDFAKPIYTEFFKKLQKLAVPIIYYPGAQLSLYKYIKELSFQVLACDWRVEIKDLIFLRAETSIQGNLDPLLLLGENNKLKERVLHLLAESKKHFPGRHIFNVGHGLTPETSVSAIEEVIKLIRAGSF